MGGGFLPDLPRSGLADLAAMFKAHPEIMVYNDELGQLPASEAENDSYGLTLVEHMRPL